MNVAEKIFKPNKYSFKVLILRAIGPLIVYIWFVWMMHSEFRELDSWIFSTFVIIFPLLLLIACMAYAILSRRRYSLILHIDTKNIYVKENFFKKTQSYTFKSSETFRARKTAGGGLPHIASSKDVEFGHYLSVDQHLEILETLNRNGRVQ